MNAAIISIGDEILIGQIVNTNAAWISMELSLKDVEIIETLTIKDEVKSIEESLERMCNKVDLVLITGGLGPTKDDVTKVAICNFLECESIFSQSTFDLISRYFITRNRTMSELHRAQCYMPANCTLLKNNMGTAPGMLFVKGKTKYISMPGVPYEMKDIMINEVLPKQINIDNEISILYKTLMIAGMGETDIAERISEIENNLTSNLSIAYLPNLGFLRLRLTAKGADKRLQEKYLNDLVEKIKSRLEPYVYSDYEISLEEKVAELCKQKGLKIGTAESCTGGLVAKTITDLPGSSEYFIGSIIAYSNSIKNKLLEVSQDTLEMYGAVSENTVKQMVIGANKILGSDISVAVSGVAGPGGGTEEKPVGTIWIAVGNEQKVVTKLLRGIKDRDKNRIYSSNIAMNELRKFLEQIK
jgi:nicotinamide-nucleotide amidase